MNLLLSTPLVLSFLGCLPHTGGAAVPEEQAALPTDVDALIASGRDHLDAGRPEEAQALFEQASNQEGGSFRTQLWLIRSWMDQGRNNDSLDAIDALRKAGREGPEIEYLYGMAFARRADAQIREGAGGSSIQMNIEDATEFLSNAVAADPERFRDAFLPLATSAWYAQDLDRGRTAAEKAVELYPANPAAFAILGKVSFSQFQSTKDPEATEPKHWGQEANAHWKVARSAFAKAAKLYGNPVNDPAARYELSQTHMQLGHAFAWKGDKKEAAKAYGDAMSWAPESIDYRQVMGILAPTEEDAQYEDFNDALHRGCEGFAKRFPESDTRDAMLLWWRGYSDFHIQKRDDAEQAFLAAVTKEPGFVNSWYYIALARYDRKAYDESIQALRSGWGGDPSVIVAEMKTDDAKSIAKLEYMIGWCVGEKRELDASLLAEICAETALTEPRHWNNMGLFLRDHGDRLIEEMGEEQDVEELDRIFARSRTAYERALRLSPDDPQLLNDTAVMLHYYQGRDLLEAQAMYARAAELAEAKLAESDLSKDDRERYRIAKRDAEENGALLADLLAELRREAEAAAAAAAEEKAEEEVEEGEDPGKDGRFLRRAS